MNKVEIFGAVMEDIKQKILERILKGEFPLRTRMPSERKFADELGCSQNMVHRALRSLVEEKILLCRPNNGYFIAPAGLKNSSSGKKFALISRGGEGSFSMALRREATLRGCEIVIYCMNIDHPQLVNDIMKDASISGIFFHVDASQANSWSDIFDELYREHYPIIALDVPIVPGALSVVGSNLFRIGFRAAELLYRYGNRAVVCGYKRSVGDSSLRCVGFKAGCNAFHWAEPIECYIVPSRDNGADEKFFDEMFSRYAGEFDTVFTSTRGFTMALAEYLKKHPELQPGRDFNWLGAEVQTVFPDQPFVIDVLVQQYDLLAQSAFDMMERAMAQRGSGIVTSQVVDAIYRSGNTINRLKTP